MNRKQLLSLKKQMKKMSIKNGDLIQVPADTDIEAMKQIVEVLRVVCPEENEVAVVAGDINQISNAELNELGLYRRFDVDGYTAKVLIEKIRNAKSLDELLRLVGASQEDIDLSYTRMREIDYMWGLAQEKEWGADHSRWPHPYDSRYSGLLADQRSFENKYC